MFSRTIDLRQALLGVLHSVPRVRKANRGTTLYFLSILAVLLAFTGCTGVGARNDVGERKEARGPEAVLRLPVHSKTQNLDSQGEPTLSSIEAVGSRVRFRVLDAETRRDVSNFDLTVAAMPTTNRFGDRTFRVVGTPSDVSRLDGGWLEVEADPASDVYFVRSSGFADQFGTFGDLVFRDGGVIELFKGARIVGTVASGGVALEGVSIEYVDLGPDELESDAGSSGAAHREELVYDFLSCFVISQPRTRSDHEGAFTFSDLQETVASVEFSIDGHVRARRGRVHVPRGEVVDIGTIDIGPLGAVVILIRVSDEDDQGLRLKLKHVGTNEVWIRAVGASSEVEFSRLPSGRYVVAVLSSLGDEIARSVVELEAGARTEVELVVDPR